MLALTAGVLPVGCGGGGGDGGNGEELIAACPNADNLTDTTEWPDCLAGQTIAGIEPFSGTACELRVSANGRFEYVRDGVVALTLPDRLQWGNATGLYQNTLISGVRLFLAVISPDTNITEGQPNVVSIDLTFSALEGQEDTVEVEYIDIDLTRKTYNCHSDLF